ncbi:MAG: DNA-directed RNA polymerase subunit omega [bacterium]
MVAKAGYDHSFEAAMNKVKNRFLLSVVLAKRVAQLRKGAEPLVDAKGLATMEEIVYQEIIEDKLEWQEASLQDQVGDMDPEMESGGFDDDGE